MGTCLQPGGCVARGVCVCGFLAKMRIVFLRTLCGLAPLCFRVFAMCVSGVCFFAITRIVVLHICAFPRCTVSHGLVFFRCLLAAGRPKRLDATIQTCGDAALGVRARVVSNNNKASFVR